jgi:AraC-like DNA-binding protein
LTRGANRLTPDATMPPVAVPQTAALYLGPLVRLMDERGLDADALLARHGLAREAIAAVDAKVEVAVTTALIEEARVCTGEPALGLALLRYTNYSAFGALGVSLAAGGSLRAVLARITRYHALVSDAMASRLDERDGRLVVLFEDRTDATPHPQSILYVMACLAGFVRLRLSRDASPVHVVLRGVDEDCMNAARRHFRCEVTSGDTPRIEYAASVGGALLEGTDPEVAALLEATLGARLARMDRPLSVQLALFLESRFPEGEPTLAEAAKAVHLSERSLQRRLRDEDLTWQKLVEDTRRALAERHLRTPGTSVTELAFVLGFSDVSSFSRAFRKWYGVPASRYRKGS